MTKKILTAALLLAAFSVLPRGARAGVFSEEEKARLNKSSDSIFSKEEMSRMGKAPESSVKRAVGGSYGVELSGAYWKLGDSALKDLKAAFAGPCASFDCRYKNDQGAIGAGAAIFWETGAEARFGVSAGYSLLPSGELHFDVPSASFSEVWKDSAYSLPVTLYVKMPQSDSVSLVAGASAEYIKAKVELTDNAGDKTEYTAGKIVPGASAGFEMFPAENVSVMLGLKYLFGGKIEDLEDKDGNKLDLTYDFSGLRAVFAVRCYFGGR